MPWFSREKKDKPAGGRDRRVKTEGLWLKCEGCSQIIWKKMLDENLQCARTAIITSESTREPG